MKMNLPWIARTAWRDSRGRRRTLLLFILCVVCGIAALTAIRGFRANLEATMDQQARTLLGADLELSSLHAFPPELEDWIAALGGEQTREVTFNSMAWFPRQEQSRLVRVRAIDGRFPFYGAFEREPADATWSGGPEPVILAEEALLHQFGLERGDPIRLGDEAFVLRGSVTRFAGERVLAGVFAPRVFVDLRHLEESELIAYGSIRRHRVYFCWEDGLTGERQAMLREERRGLFEEHNIRVRTVESETAEFGRNLDNLYSFLNLAGFIALLLGGIGVAGAVQIYLREKRANVALLRCLGAPIRSAFAVYLLQVVTVGCAGAAFGSLLGVAVQFLLPGVLAPFLPFPVEVFLAWEVVGFGLFFGWLVAVLFALLPLLPLRRISPMAALRADVEPPSTRRDPLFWGAVLAIVALALAFCLTQTARVAHGIGFAAALACVLVVLWALAGALRWGMRRFVGRGAPFIVRQAVANLYRPNNRTLFLMVTLGMGVFLLHTLYLSRDLLLSEVSLADRAGAPNLIFFDIQPDQAEGAIAAVEAAGHPVFETAPIVTMRLRAINGVPVAERRRDAGDAGSDTWAYTREYRSTFRGERTDTERLIAGEWIGSWDGPEPVPVSIEEGIKETLRLSLGDELRFDVQGVPIRTTIASVREVDWSQIRTNFFFVFPEGVLEEAPAFYALVTRAEDRAAAARLQNRVVQAYPNISAVDLSLLLDTLDTVLGRVAFAIQFMAAFTVGTGAIVLLSAIWTTRYQRLQESALLRTLGASGMQMRGILSLEYLIVGLLSGAAGVILSLGAGYALARFVFEIGFAARWTTALTVILAAGLLTLACGLIFSRGATRHPPCRVLTES